MQEPPRAVLFDWEGTLVDFQWNLAQAVDHAQNELVSLGLDRASLENHYALLRNKSVVAASAGGVDWRVARDAVDRVYDRYDYDALSRWSLRPGARSTLQFLGDRQIAAGLVTNIGRRAVERALSKFELETAFRVVVTRDDVSMLKPETEGILAALSTLGVSPDAALFVGDSTSDARAANKAGVPVAILAGGENGSEMIAVEKPTFMWDSLEMLRTLFTGGG